MKGQSSRKSKSCDVSPNAHGGGSRSKSRLTACQKSDNHKEAENRRRNGIRDQYVALSHLVPDTEGQAKSEEKMLVKTAEHLRLLLDERRELLRRLHALNGDTSAFLISEKEWGEPEWRGHCEQQYLGKRIERMGEQALDEVEDSMAG